jgi:Rrf2 family protein
LKLSVKSDYAARAVLSLARRHHLNVPTRLDEIASENGLPAGYLVQILIELKSHQIVRSIRGKEGGYQLSRSPAEISLADVLRCMHGPLFESPAMADPRCAPELRDGWRQLQAGVDAEAGKINFQQMLDSGGDRGRMFYI